MCYHNSVKTKDFVELSEIKIPIFPTKIDYANGFTNPDWPVLVADAKGSIASDKMEWGFLPGYIQDREAANNFRHGYKDAKGYHPAITALNAIAEEMLDKSMFKKAARETRCLVLSSGFYEWKHVPKIGKQGQPLKATDKLPHFISLPGREYFYMAGIYNKWTDRKSGELAYTFAICTTKANSLMEEIHNSKKRMPLILPDDMATNWLNKDLSEADIKEIAHHQIKEDQMTAYEIAKDFQSSSTPQQPA